MKQNIKQQILFSEVLFQSTNLFKAKLKSIFLLCFTLVTFMSIIEVYFHKSALHFLNYGVFDSVPMALGVGLACIVLQCLIKGVILVSIYDSMLKPDLAKALYYVIRLLPTLILNTIVYLALLIGGLSLYRLVLPALIPAIFCALYTQIILFEQKTGLSPLIESFHRVKPYFLLTFGCVTVCFIFRYLPIFIFQAIFKLIVNSPSSFGIDQAILIFISSIALAFNSAVYVALYDSIKKATIYNQKANKLK